jgi:drug/metabolite transporter (DMT)-like permease
LGNKAYVYLDAAFLQMLKAATPALLMVALILFRIEKITLNVSMCCVVMVVGSILAALHTPELNAIGIMVQLGSQGTEVMQNVMMQFFMQQLSFTALDAGYYIAPCSSLCCLVLSLVLESEMLMKDGGQLLLSQVGWLCASGVVGVAVNFSSFFVIQFISSLMAKLIVVARSAGLVTVLIAFYGESFTPMQLLGYAITLMAFGAYSAFKVTETRDLTPSMTLSKSVATEQKEDMDMDLELSEVHSDEPLMGKS